MNKLNRNLNMWIHVLCLTVMIAATVNYANGLSTTGDRGKCARMNIFVIFIFNYACSVNLRLFENAF